MSPRTRVTLGAPAAIAVAGGAVEAAAARRNTPGRLTFLIQPRPAIQFFTSVGPITGSGGELNHRPTFRGCLYDRLAVMPVCETT
jgi:hypothetical protein